MLFRGRTVVVFVLISIVSTAIVTLTVADRWLLPPDSPDAGSAGQHASGQSGLSGSEIDKLNAVFTLIQDKYYRETDRDKMVDGAISGMVSALGDPYSVYLEDSAARHFSESVEGAFNGIGAEVTMKSGKVVVMSALKGSPAERAGLRAKDIVLSVNGESLEGLELSEAVEKIRGPKGTKAKLAVQRAGESNPIELIVIRDEIDLETVYARMLPDGVGLLEIRQFSLHTYDRFREELETLEAQGMKALLIDLRNNPGGVLPVVVSIAQTMIAKGEPIVLLEDRSGKREQTVSNGPGTSKPYPIGVLIDHGSASAAEILAAALHESAGAVLIGETTFGKGTVQVNYDKATGDGSLVKMTITKWLTPNGNWVHETGIAPDIAVSQPDFYRVGGLSKTETLVADTVGEDVRNMQIMLDALGYVPDRKDGYFSAATEQALRNFQRDAGLEQSGMCTAETARELESRVRSLIVQGERDKQLDEAVRTLLAKGADRGGAPAAGVVSDAAP